MQMIIQEEFEKLAPNKSNQNGSKSQQLDFMYQLQQVKWRPTSTKGMKHKNHQSYNFFLLFWVF